MKIKTSTLTGAALDWAVAKCEGAGTPYIGAGGKQRLATCQYSTDWAQGGPIIEREHISIRQWENVAEVYAYMPGGVWSSGSTPLIAAMRCFASKAGDEVYVPEELI